MKNGSIWDILYIGSLLLSPADLACLESYTAEMERGK